MCIRDRPTTFFNRGSPAKAEDSSGANRTIPRVDPADKAKEAERAQAGSAPTKSRRHSPNALSAELRRLAPVSYTHLDKAASKGVIHKNQAANRKSGIMRLANTVVTAEDIACLLYTSRCV